jgi:hypothetical protein
MTTEQTELLKTLRRVNMEFAQGAVPLLYAVGAQTEWLTNRVRLETSAGGWAVEFNGTAVRVVLSEAGEAAAPADARLFRFSYASGKTEVRWLTDGDFRDFIARNNTALAGVELKQDGEWLRYNGKTWKPDAEFALLVSTRDFVPWDLLTPGERQCAWNAEAANPILER